MTTARGQCIRFSVDDVRVFKGRDSMGVRGIALAEGDSVISLAILKSFDASPAERAAYLKQRRAAAEGEAAEEAEADAESEDENGAEANGASALEPERFEAMRAAEQVILTISENGFGKRSSSFEYRVTGRGGKGIVAMAVNDAQWLARRLVPGGGERRDHAGDRRRAAHPGAGRRHPHRRAARRRA